MRWVLVILCVTTAGVYAFGPEAMMTAGSDIAVDPVSENIEDFEIVIEDARPCGSNCGTATIQLTNTGASTATGVSVTTTVYPGKTDRETELWTDTKFTAEVPAGETATWTERATWGQETVDQVRSADRRVAFEIVVQTDDRVVVFSGTEHVG